MQVKIYSLLLILFCLFSCNKNEEFIEYYSNGEIKLEAELLKGLKHGEQIEYFQNGLVKSVTHWKNDTLNGPYTRYFENGIISNKGQFLMGKLHGPYEIRFEDGGIKQKGYYNQGNRIGTQTVYTEKGEVLSLKNFVSYKGEETLISAVTYTKDSSPNQKNPRVNINQVDTTSFNDFIKVDVELVNPPFKNSRLIIGNFDESFKPMDTINIDTVYLQDHQTVLSLEAKKKGFNIVKGYVDNFEVIKSKGDTTVTKNAIVFFEFGYVAI